MKFGLRIPSIKKRLAARTSLKRVIRHSVGVKAPRGMGIITNPKRAIYNKVYNQTSISADKLAKGGFGALFALIGSLFGSSKSKIDREPETATEIIE